MKFENLSSINQEKFTIELKLIQGKPNIIFNGVIDLPDPGILLTPYFTELHDAVLENSSEEIIFDITELTYINSSGIKAIIKYVLKILHLEAEKKYKILLYYN